MGLDMYLYKKTYVKNWSHMQPEELTEIIVNKMGKPHPTIKTERICYIVEEVGYWRKFNALHKWFVDKTQNGIDECQESHVSREQLQELLTTLKNVLKCKGDKEAGEKFFPTEGGFFFGRLEYDEWYWNDVEETAELIENLLKEDETVDGWYRGEYYYRASW